jgi:hypothetical protein
VNADETAAAQAEEAQTAQPLPEGHPPLPQGHPQVSQEGMQQMQRFHGGQLPQGHPPVAAAEPKVYETTEVQPAWTVAMRHLIVRPMDSQLFITEVWAVNNPTDKSYIGAPVAASAEETADAKSQAPAEAQPAATAEAGDATCNMADMGRTTLVLPLPAGATHVQPGTGFDACCVKVEEGKLISSMPLNPGTTQMRVSYLLAPKDGVFELPLGTPAPTGHLMVFLPEDDAQVTAKGLTAGDTFKAGDKSFRVFSGKQLEVGADIGLTIKPAQQAADSAMMMPTGGVAPMADASGQIKLIAGIGAGAMLVAATFVLLKPAKKQVATSVVL